MSLAAALANATKPNVRRTRLDEIWDALDADDRAFLLDMLGNQGLSRWTVAETLTNAGHPIGQTTIGEARRSGWAANKETT